MSVTSTVLENMSHVVLITTFFTVTNTVTSYPETLRLASIIYRHGDRAPEHTFPTNPVPVSAWPNGLGALTSTGIGQHYRLGKYVRERYRGFINDSYVASEIRVRSTDVDRTLMSAEAHLAGLYPPSGYQVWCHWTFKNHPRLRHVQVWPISTGQSMDNRQCYLCPTNTQKWSETLLWQPIPVHTVPLDEDNLLFTRAFCPRLAHLYKEYHASSKTRSIVKENRQLFEFLAEKTGVDDVNMANVHSIGDAFICQSAHEYPQPQWFNDTLQRQMMKIIEYEYRSNFSSVESTRLSGGSLLREITENMVDKTTNDNSDAKIFMYSTHDQTLGAFLATLQIDRFSLPLSYVATIFVELHESPSQGFYVKVVYKTLPISSKPRIITVKGCTAECSLTKFRALTKKYIPVDWKKECEFPVVLKDVNHSSELSSPKGTMSFPMSKTRSSLQSETRSSPMSETRSSPMSKTRSFPQSETRLSQISKTRSFTMSETRSSRISKTSSSLQSETRSTIGFMVLCYLSGVATVLVVMCVDRCIKHAGYHSVNSR